MASQNPAASGWPPISPAKRNVSEDRPISVVAIPARDEAERVVACLEALDGQIATQVDHVVLLANNCTDRTAHMARAVSVRDGTSLHVIECDLPDHQANAGYARYLAVQEAARLAGSDGVILTTDADGRVDPDWLYANLAALAAGADAVCGWVELDPVEWGRIPTILHEDDARECAYDDLCDRLHALLDPDPADPLPRHTQHSGASIAVRASALARCGGVPRVASGEDRALVAALRRLDMRVRHAPEVHVVVSGRIEGRSAGGMADTIRRRMSAPDPYLDDRLEPAADCARRAIGRSLLRQVIQTGQGTEILSLHLGIEVGRISTLMQAGLGEAWHMIEAESPMLRRRRVAVADLPTEMEAAQAILRALRPLALPVLA